jgi:glycosyltransferase involved in cell wall biosynthesis
LVKRDMSGPDRNKRVLIFIVAYNAERTIQDVVRRIPASLARYDTEILIIDDSSRDDTFGRAHVLEKDAETPFPIRVLYNPVNQGYGGNQKIGFRYAIENGFDIVALVHGDGQYKPECLPDLLQPLLDEEADAVFGSRMMARLGAIKGGMPLYKYAGNKTLTAIQNTLLHSSLSEFHSGYRLYSVRALKRVPFDRNTNDFHFDTEIIIQFLRAGLLIKELPIPTYYGDEICHVNGLRYAWDVIRATLLASAQDFGILYERKFDVVQRDERDPGYQPKLGFESAYRMTLARIPAGSRVASIGGASVSISRELTEKGCPVTEVDDLSNRGDITRDSGTFDYILLLDVLDHLPTPEKFLDSLRDAYARDGGVRVIVSAGNIGFFITRFALLFGGFNYSPRGILDLTHTRLFTFRTLRVLLEQSGYRIAEARGIPAPFPLVLGKGFAGRMAMAVNKALIWFWKSLFAYEIFLVCTPLPTLEWLLQRASESRQAKIESAIQPR